MKYIHKILFTSIIFISIFFNLSAEESYYATVVDAVKKHFHLSQDDVPLLRKGFDKKSVSCGVMSAFLMLKYCTANSSQRMENKFDIMKPKDNYFIGLLGENIACLLGALGFTYGAIKFYTEPVTIEQAFDAIKEYIRLSETLAVTKKEYATVDDLRNEFVVLHNTAWIGKSSLVLYNEMQKLIDQGSYFLEVLDAIQDRLSQKDEISIMYQQINQYLMRLYKNQELVRCSSLKCKKEENRSYKNIFFSCRFVKTMSTLALHALKLCK